MTLEEEAALAYVWVRQNEKNKSFTNPDLGKAYKTLEAQSIIRKTSKDNNTVFAYSLTRKGTKYYKEIRKARTEDEPLSDEADALMLCLAVEDERKPMSSTVRYVSQDLTDPIYYSELKKHKLVNYSDVNNKPYLPCLSNKGREYANSEFPQKTTKEPSNVLNCIMSVIIRLTSTITSLLALWAFGKQIFDFIVKLF